MEIAVLLQPVAGNGYRATRDEALVSIQRLVEERAGHGAEVVALRIPARTLPAKPPWPDDETTKAWLEGIAEYRKERNSEPDPWDDDEERIG